MLTGTGAEEGIRELPIVRFGEARIVLNAASKMELLGGSPAEREEARAWAELFLPPSQCAALETGGTPLPYELWGMTMI